MAKNKLVEKIIKDKVKKKDDELGRFIRRFYEHVSGAELDSINQEELFEKASDAFTFLQNFKGNKPKVEVFNPPRQEKRPRTILKVLNKDMPFLVDSVTAELNRRGLKIHEIYHPILKLNRDKKGKFKDFHIDGKDESLIYLQISRVRAGKPCEELAQNLEEVLSSVTLAVKDWPKMLGELRESLVAIKYARTNFEDDEVNETEDFLKWLGDNHFTFLGYVEYNFDKKGKLLVDDKSRLGIMREEAPDRTEVVEAETIEFAKNKDLVDITKSEHKAIVHRNVYMDQVGIKKFDNKGNVVGERWFSGLFASSAYYQTTDQIPVIRKKVRHVLNESGFVPGGHSTKIAQFILDSYPRDEIFQSDAEMLFENTMAIIELIKRPRVGLFIREDKFSNFLSTLIYIPKEKLDTNLRIRLQEILEIELKGEVKEYYTQITDSPLSRLHLVLKPRKENFADYDFARVERKIVEAANAWSEVLMGVLFAEFGESKGDELFEKYEDAFSQSYLTQYAGSNALHDIQKIESCLESSEVEVEIYQQVQQLDTNELTLKTFNPGSQLALSEILPILENMGLWVIAERPFNVRPVGYDGEVRVREFQLQTSNGASVNISEVKDIFEKALKKTLNKEIENDSLNRLVLYSKLAWRDVVLLRAYTQYLQQVGVPLGVAYVRDALANQPEIAALLVELFYSYFSIKKSKEKSEDISKDIYQKLQSVDNLNEDVILRRFNETIQATLRTNFFQQGKDYISIKVDSAKVPYMPKPYPHVEVFVYSKDVEGVHLRGGKVARGGLRWSDRNEDFRTEVLGLMKAQMVKNSVIVPVGSKGGFVVKNPINGDRTEKQNQGIECYKTFLSGILDITDNLVRGKVVHPEDVVRRDGEDPYLVVAADKGTATFSDIANGVSEDYGFWLDDAFASGGSVGYDHKAMGITAKGAWVSVMRHFREMGHDTQSQDFTVAGIGDMMGDVFGNGMLLSKHIRLVAAFNHMHIFVDPNPDSAKTYKERDRLFKLPRSSWEDYDKKLISKGGGVFSRSDKSIKITKEMKEALDIKSDKLTPDELIKAILVAPVDLLWNGGIGTYVKAENETNRQVGDKANDNLRINGNELRCKVIGEGGNLGFTQLGRIEFAQKGGKVNTDAIDNSAGVDCSDHEVNIKIALAKAVENKKLSMPARNKLLEEMTDEVSELVLRDNYLQTQAISIAEHQGVDLLEAQQALIQSLESTGELEREIEYLPDDEEITHRMADGKGLTRPELSVILSYAKNSLYRDILDSNVPDEDYFKEDLIMYFPTAMRKKFKSLIENHQLRREIVATFLTNSMVNRAGSTFFHSITKDTGMEACDIARSYTVARDAFGLRDVWKDIEDLDGKVDHETQAEMVIHVGKFIETMTFWFLRNLPQPISVSKVVDEFGKDINEFAKILPKIVTRSYKKANEVFYNDLVSKKVPKALAEKISNIDALTSACDVAIITKTSKLQFNVVGKVYFELGAKLSLGWLRHVARQIHTENYWDRLALRNVVDSLYEQQRRLAIDVTKSACKSDKCDIAVETWLENHDKEVKIHQKMIKELKAADRLSISMLVSAVRRIEGLCRL